ncbi:MAG: response regulator [Abditibacteriales bacterium]|nr:response regulator [Abditibacteriales bacterium]MDW8367954.1 response regulator [Abditibacteriales bacterium]
MEAQKKKILIIDDEPFVVRILQANLKIEGYEVVAASDGEQGLRAARREQPSLIILDVMLPKMSGWEVLTALRADAATRHIPVLILTVLHEMEEPERQMTSLAQGFLTKPFEPMALIAAVHELLGETA